MALRSFSTIWKATVTCSTSRHLLTKTGTCLKVVIVPIDLGETPKQIVTSLHRIVLSLIRFCGRAFLEMGGDINGCCCRYWCRLWYWKFRCCCSCIVRIVSYRINDFCLVISHTCYTNIRSQGSIEPCSLYIDHAIFSKLLRKHPIAFAFQL